MVTFILKYMNSESEEMKENIVKSHSNGRTLKRLIVKKSVYPHSNNLKCVQEAQVIIISLFAWSRVNEKRKSKILIFNDFYSHFQRLARGINYWKYPDSKEFKFNNKNVSVCFF